MTNYWAVEVSGVGQLIDRMKRFDADTWQILQSELKDAGGEVAQAAQRAIPTSPLRNWGPWTVRRVGRGGGVYTRDLSFNATAAKSRIKPVIKTPRRKGDTRKFWVQVQEMDPSGAIWMLAGSRDVSKTAFNKNINRRWGTAPFGSGFWPRALTPALYSRGTPAFAAIEAALNRAIDRVNNG